MTDLGQPSSHCTVEAPWNSTHTGPGTVSPARPAGFCRGPGHRRHSPHNGQSGDAEHEGRLIVINHVLGQVPEVEGPVRREGQWTA